jgi:O-antigen/teichoic acid export membrane protein
MLLGGMTVLRSVVFALVRVTTLWFLLYGLGIKDVLVMFAAWIVADLVSCSVLYAYARFKRMRPHPGKFVLPLAQQAIGSALRHHVLNFMLNLSGMFVPIIVAAVLSAEPNAMFSVAWNNTSFAFSIPYALTSVFYAAGQQQPLTIQGKLRQLLLMGAGASALAGVVFWIAAPLLMRSFGASYVSQATFAIRVIVLAVFPVLIKGLWVTLLRIRGHMRLALRATSLGGILELGLPALGGLWYGVPGACIGWLISQVILAAVFAVPVLQATRESP